MDDRWEDDGAQADYWKDPNQRAQEAVAAMKEYLDEALRLVGPAKLLEMRAKVARDPACAGLVEMIDRHLKRSGGH